MERVSIGAQFGTTHASILVDHVMRFARDFGTAIDSLLKTGIDVINPVQTNCRDMEPEKLKTEFGRYICFWGGGCDTRQVLNRATPAEVKTHVLERLKIFVPGGGFVFNTVHNIQAGTPVENIVALVDAVHEFNGVVA